MLITGDIDNNVHPANTYRLVDALIKANKRFDFMILPGLRHPYTSEAAYVNQRRADYFCRYLLGSHRGVGGYRGAQSGTAADGAPGTVATSNASGRCRNAWPTNSQAFSPAVTGRMSSPVKTSR